MGTSTLGHPSMWKEDCANGLGKPWTVKSVPSMISWLIRSSLLKAAVTVKGKTVTAQPGQIQTMMTFRFNQTAGISESVKLVISIN